jgi:predicted ATPase
VWLVDLAALADGSVLELEIAGVLGIVDRTGRHASQVVLDYLRDRELLLVLDNCEHLLDACAGFADRALRAAGALRLLCTSRQPLGMPGEHIVTVPPLPVPDLAVPEPSARGYPAVALFIRRAAAVVPGFRMTVQNHALIVEICRRLDGLPLAIELAAVQVRAMPIEQLAAGLRERFDLLSADLPPARHRTLAATFDWSYSLCSPLERLLWARVSVFAGSFDPDAAEYVCGGDVSAEQVFEALVGLVDKSVLIAEQDVGRRRYRLLETVRQYGQQRLRDPAAATAMDEVALASRHRDYYERLAERFHADWFGPHQPEWSRRMHAELPNLRTALGLSLTVGEQPRTAVRLAGALYYFWFGCGEGAEGRYWLNRALTADPQPSPERIRALAAYSRILTVQGAAAAEPARQCLALALRFDAPLYHVDALQSLGLSLVATGEHAAGRSLLEEAVTRAERLGHAHPATVFAKQHLGLAVLIQGDADRAQTLLADSQAICRAQGERWWLGHSLLVAVIALLALGNTTKAGEYAREGLEAAEALGDRLGSASALEFLAWIAASDHNYPPAARLLGTAARQWRAIGGSPLGASYWTRGHQDCETSTRKALGDRAFDTQFRRGLALNSTEAIRYALRSHQRASDPQ